MKINADIVRDYIEGKSIISYSDKWFFNTQGYSYAEPSYESDHIESVRRIYTQIKDSIDNFIPCNLKIWDALFPNWKEILDSVIINLIIGYPEPNDATVLKEPDGQNNVILDLGLWTKYEGKCDITGVIHNLLTHELCHVCIGKTIKDIDADIESSDYIINLDANTFHEGFAHLVSYDDKDIDMVQWDSESLQKVKAKSKSMMRSALFATDSLEQKKYLYDAIYGNYYDKYACMCGMLYLVDCWKAKGILGLEEEMKKGYQGFSKRTIGEALQDKHTEKLFKDFLNAYNECFYKKDLASLKEFYDTNDNILIYFDNHKNNDTYSLEEHLKLISDFFNNGKLTEVGEAEPLIIENFNVFHKGEAACLCFLSRYKSFPVPAVRSTLYLECTDGTWKIMHAHFSFEPEK